MSQAGVLNAISGNPQVPILFETDGSSAVPIANTLEVVGDGSAITTDGSGNTITITFSASGLPEIPTVIHTDGSDVTPALNAFSVLGVSGITTSGAGSVLTITGSDDTPTTFTADSSFATPAANNINVVGDGSAISTSGSGDTLTITFDASGLPSIATEYATDSGSATPALNVLNILGGEGVDTSAAGSTITISGEDATDANKGIASFTAADFDVTAGAVSLEDTVVKSVAGDSGTATPSGHSFTIAGAGGITTAGLGSTITITAGASIPTTFTGDSGSATPATNNLNVFGTNGIDTSGATDTLTVSISTPGDTTPLASLRIANATYITARNGADSADLDVMALNAFDEVNIANGISGVNFGGNIKPFSDGASDCGVETIRWKDLYISGDAHIPLTANGIVLGGGTAATNSLSVTSELSDGQLLVGSTGNPPSEATLTAGGGISITNAAGSITIATIGGGFPWTVVTGTTQALAVDNGYIGNNGTGITYTLPSTAAVGSVIKITNIGAGLATIAQNASQSINVVGSTTTVGAGGSLVATQQFDSIDLVCVVEDLTFNVLSLTGSWTIV